MGGNFSVIRADPGQLTTNAYSNKISTFRNPYKSYLAVIQNFIKKSSAAMNYDGLWN